MLVAGEESPVMARLTSQSRPAVALSLAFFTIRAGLLMEK